MEETLSETTENYVTINPVTKKKVRVVKKIVKKKIIKKVPKRNVCSAASNCNDLEKVTNPNPNVDFSSFMEIEKLDGDVGGFKDDESVKEVLDENKISCLVALLGDQVHNKLEDSDPNRIELRDSDQNGIELQDSDRGRIESHDGDRSRIEMQDNDRKRIESQDSDWGRIEPQDSDRGRIESQDREGSRIEPQDDDRSRIELQDSDRGRIESQDSEWSRIEPQDDDRSRLEMQDGDENRIELQEGDQNRSELQDSDLNRIGLQNYDQDRSGLQNNEQDGSELLDGSEDRVELVDREHDANSMNVEEHEGEESVKEIIVKGETDGLKSQEGLSESNVPSGKTVASRLHMKRMRKIFIHGFGQETKEEDIRKVFEEVGEVVEVKLVINFRSGKNRGFGFITFASGELANLALNKYQNVEICGRPCRTSAIEGIDTILLDNIDKKWHKEHVVELLQKMGIKKIDEVLVVPDPDNAELNCGFAFLEFETKRDAQMAYDKLQNGNVFGKDSNLKVSWASSSVNPVEEEIHNNKSVYAENIPLSWDEKEVSNHFKMFGEIESIALAKNLRSAKRNDFAFINYKTCEAALSCIEALTCKKSTSNNDPTGQLKVSLAKSIPKVKPIKTVSVSAVTEVSQAYQNANRSRQSQNQYQNAYLSRQSQQNLSYLGVYKPMQKPKIMIGKYEDSRKDSASSTTAELVQLLREQASWKQGGPSSTAGHHQPPFGRKQQFTEPGSKSIYHHDPRAYHQSHHIPNVTQPRPIANVTSLPHYDQQRVHYTSGSVNLPRADPRYIQTRDQTTYPGSSSIYRRTH